MSMITNTIYTYFIKNYKESLAIVLASMISSGIPFFMIPIITYYLSPVEYGYLAYLGAIVGMASVFCGLQPHLFLIVKHGELDRIEKSQYISLSFLFTVIFGFLVCIFIALFIRPFLTIELSLFTIIAICIIAICRSGLLILDAVLQSEKKLIKLSILLVLQAIIHYSLAILFLEYFFQNWQGKFYAELISAILMLITGIYLIHSLIGYSFSFKFSQVVRLLKYSTPLSFHAFSIVVMASIDRLMIVEIMNLESAGIYVVAYAFGGILGIFHNALLKVWNPVFYKLVKNLTNDSKLNIVSVSYAYFFLSVIVLIFFSYIGPFFYLLMVSPAYFSGESIIPIVAFAYTIEAVRKVFVAYLFSENKVILIAALGFVAILINITLNYLLIPIYGVYGAAWATVLSYFIVTIITIHKSVTIFPMPWMSLSISIERVRNIFKSQNW